MGLEYNLIIILLLYLMLLLLLAMMIFFLMPSLRKLSNIMGLSFSIDRSTCGEVSHFFVMLSNQGRSSLTGPCYNYVHSITQFLRLYRWRMKFFVKLGRRVSPRLRIWSCFDAVNHPTLHFTSILDEDEVFLHLHMLWMGIWVHHYTVTPLWRWGPNWENWG